MYGASKEGRERALKASARKGTKLRGVVYREKAHICGEKNEYVRLSRMYFVDLGSWILIKLISERPDEKGYVHPP